MAHRFQKNLSSIPGNDLKKILIRIQDLGEDPRRAGCEKPTGPEPYRLRQGRYRIVYSIQDAVLTIWIINVGQPKDVYRE